jgi:hypothetical protein
MAYAQTIATDGASRLTRCQDARMRTARLRSGTPFRASDRQVRRALGMLDATPLILECGPATWTPSPHRSSHGSTESVVYTPPFRNEPLMTGNRKH